MTRALDDDLSRDESPATRACPGCGGVNAAERVLCGACGLDLATGDPDVTVTPPSTRVRTWPVAAVSHDDRAPGIRWWVPLVALLLVVGGVTAAIVGNELGPFAPTEELPPTDFDAASYPGDPEPLALSDVATLTFRSPEGQRSFTPEHLVDGDQETAWHGDADDLPRGVEENIDLFLEEPAWVEALVVDNGDQLDAGSYAATARVQSAVLVFDGDREVPVTLLDRGLAPQIVELEEPILTATVRLQIQDQVAGTERDDVALTGLELLGHPARGDDVVLAQEREELRPAAGTVTLPS